MNIRWLKKADGTKVLQYLSVTNTRTGVETWRDVETIEDKPKAREFWLMRVPGHRIGEAMNHYHILEQPNFETCKKMGAELIHVREVLNEDAR